MKKLLAFYIALLALISVFSYAFIDPNFPPLYFLYYGLWSDFRVYLTVAYVIIIVFLYVFYAYILKSLAKDKTHILMLLKIISACVLVLLFSCPTILSYDIFNYVATARVTYFYHENPYVVMPIEMTGDPMLGFTRAANKLALYGPSWILLTIVPFTLGLGQLLLTTYLFKIFVGLFYFGIVYLIYKITKSTFATAMFALNPLVLIETFVSGHNDVVMMFFCLLAFYLFTKKRILISSLFILLSILIKFSTLFVLPVWLYCAWKLYRKEKINWDKIWFWSAILMFAAFCLSPLREEMYPWYAVWFLPFIPLVRNKFIKYGSVALTLGLMLRYIPYMLLGTYSHPTPLLRVLFTMIPLLVFVPIYFIYIRNHE